MCCCSAFLPVCRLGSILLFAFLMMAAAPSNAEAQAADARPNIVFILLDDLRWNALSCMGHPTARTPHIDRIAKEGALFRNFFVTTPLCSPSRASFLTGQYVHTHGVTTNGPKTDLSHRFTSFPLLLQRVGYTTAWVGKVHMGNDDSPRPGFDRWVSFKGQGVYENPEINVDGTSRPMEGYLTDILSQFAVDFVRAPHRQPFLLYLSHKAVHGPNIPAPRHRELYAGAELTFAPSVDSSRAAKPALARISQNPPSVSGALNQLRTLAAVDDGVGALLAALESTGRLDQTLVMFASDNGIFWSEHGLLSKRLAYEESIRSPLLVRYPRLIRAGTVVDQLALNIDVAPTLLELGGVAIPATMQGRSLLPLFRPGPVAAWRTSFLAEYFQESPGSAHPSWYAVRTERWKYIRYPDLPAADEFYDLAADPYEMKNLVADSGAAADLRAARTELDRLMLATGAK